MAEPIVRWEQLSPDAQVVLAWSLAIERAAGRVGTRGLLLAIMGAGDGKSEPDQLLAHFGLSRARLVDGLERVRKEVPIEPDATMAAPLDGMPAMTPNAEDVLRQAARLAESGGERVVDTAHLFGGVLAVSRSTASTVLAALLPEHAPLEAVAETYLEYLSQRDRMSFADVLRERYPPVQQTTGYADLPLELTPTVRSVVGALTGPVTAAAIVAETLARHPEYGGRRAGALQLDRARGPTAPVADWLARVRALLPASSPPLLHGRLLIAALARLEPGLREQLSAGEFLGVLEAEIREPLESLFVAPAAEEQEQRPAPALSPAARQVLTYAAGMLANAGSDPDDVGIARAAVLLGALHHGRNPDAPPTVAGNLLTDPDPPLDDAAASVGLRLAGLDDRPSIPGGALPPILSEAEALAARTSTTGVHLRHLLAAALSLAAPTVPEPLLAALGVTLPQLRRALWRAIAEFIPGEPAAVWDAILADPPDAFDLAGGFSRDAVDPTQGIPLTEDHLGVGTYVAMLATLIADSRTPEPLSIGLFGEWGSGKSYFMGLLRAQVDALAERGDPYYGIIRQIPFNAWHYADTNIWASLGDTIFEELAGPGESVDEQRDRLRADLAERLQRRKELKAATERAQEETRRLSKELDEASDARRTSAGALVRAAASSAAVQPQLKAAWARIGVDDPVEQGRLLGDEVRGAAADVDELRQAVRGNRGLVLMAIAAVTVVLAAAALATPAVSRWLAGTSVAALAALLTTAIAFVARVRSGLGLLHATAADMSKTLDQDTRKKMAARLDELRGAEANERVLQAQHDKVVEQVGELGRELAELSPGQRLYHFVTERAGSDEYRSQLGLISTVRKDFEQLVKLLKEWRDKGDAADAPGRIDRIVLYIDDLDRCSPQQVVAVLQAVHLLLALDLFVVVVGVDPRWLLRSLQSEYDKVLTSERTDSADTWQASPHDYLEKIFNIPFALPRMSPRGFGELLRSFTGPATPGAHETSTGAPEPGPAPTPSPDGQDGTEPSSPAPEVVLPAEEHSEAAAVTAGAAEIEMRPLTDPELTLMTSLAPLVQTPREAKRLLNLYRIVRSTRDLRPASRFLGDDSQPGEYEAVVILLGLLSGHGRLLEDVLAAQPADGIGGGLVHRGRDSSWRDFAGGLAPREDGPARRNDVVGPIAADDVAHWQRLHDGLVDASALVTLPDLDAFQFWAPRIARFSFLLSPYVAESAARADSAAGA